jgi:hypothetical protein
MSKLTKVDHITYACDKGTIEKWAWFHIEVEGGTLINRIDDVRPEDTDSSMKIWCIDYGNFGVALIEGIDRTKKSQVSTLPTTPATSTVSSATSSRLAAIPAAPRWCEMTASAS